MKPSMIEARFYETYHFATVIRNVLHDQFDFLRTLDEFYGDGTGQHFSAPFPRFSAFHAFLQFVIDDLLFDATASTELAERKSILESFREIPEAIEDLCPQLLPIEQAFAHHAIEYETFTSWLQGRSKSFISADEDDIHDYLCDLRVSASYENLLTQSVRETFFVLFGNRGLMLLFNDMMARQISDLDTEEISEGQLRHFDRRGVLKRVRIPDWVRRAVFHRDRGRCVSCGCDLSRLISIWSEEHFDHIVPLVSGGLNDVTNIQLMCGSCNRRKGRGAGFTSESYEEWYSLPEPT